jgi:glycine/D-amino acid oxidase-like deaminating enzyme
MWTAAQPVFHYSISNLARFQSPALPPWAADLSNTGWYGFPALADGTLKIANHGPGLRVDPEGGRDVAPGTVEQFRAFLAESLPELLDAPIAQTRTCLYCDTFDSDFWIDEDPQRQGLIVATGGSGHGFKFLPVIGGIVADLLEKVANPWAHRFQWRTLSDRRTEAARFMG